MSFAVVGAGVVGLSTALELQKNFPSARVSIIADKFGVDTTSDVAAGIFRPATSFTGPNDTITRKWMRDSYSYWDQLRISSDAAIAGVTRLSVYCFSSTGEAMVRNHYLEEILPLYRKCTEDELKICPGVWKYGSFYSTIVTECRLWQPWATQKFQQAGGEVIKAHVNKLTELDGRKYDAVINCSGLGAQQLCGDKNMVPIRGQVVKVHAPWIKTAFYADYDTYIIPGFNGAVTLGGTRQYESYNMQVDKYDTLSIRERCQALVPSLSKAPLLRQAVGLRPYRSQVRVDIEPMHDSNGNRLNIVHHYGHGGYGVTTSPGTSAYAIQLLRQMLSQSRSKL